MRRPLFNVVLLFTVLSLASCGARAVRGDDDPKLDQKALSVTLDKVDIDYLVDENLGALYESRFWIRSIEPASDSPRMAVLPIQNATSQHLEDQLDTVLNSINTSLINSGDVTVVARDRQEQLVRELGVEGGREFDPATAGKIGRQFGVEYFLTGKITSVDERLKKTRRLQYRLFVQMLEVETGAIRFQHEATRTKALKR